MSKFDTHGGYFAPKDYMKVEAGGSHEENPNGGVQIGVDQEGTPNLLEEGEPVYKDYVYSDNIKASERFLKENNIPEKYAGELYSKIADSFFSEAENRPYDPISRNGLEAMLGRLADAQEGQKAYNEQRQLERELKNLSPDELAALEEMLAAGEQQAMEQQAVPAEPMMQQPMMPEQQVAPQIPMMRNGGRLFAAGGDTEDPPYQPPLFFNPETGRATLLATPHAQTVIETPAVVTADDPRRIAFENQIREGTNSVAEDIYNIADEALKWSPAGPVMYLGHAGADVANGDYVQAGKDVATAALMKAAVLGSKIKKSLTPAELERFAVDKYGANPQQIKNTVTAGREKVAKLQKELDGMASKYKDKETFKNMSHQLTDQLKAEKAELSRWEKRLSRLDKMSGSSQPAAAVAESAPVEAEAPAVPEVPAANAPTEVSRFKKGLKVAGTVGAIGGGGVLSVLAGKGIYDAVQDDKEAQRAGKSTGSFASVRDYKEGGRVNRFAVGGWGNFLDTVRNYSPSRIKGGLEGKYKVDSGFDFGNYGNIGDLENSSAYRAFTNYVLTNPNNPEVQKYLKLLDAGVAPGVTTLYDGDTLRSDWKDIYRHRRTDGNAGIYHLNFDPGNLGFGYLSSEYPNSNMSIQDIASSLVGTPSSPNLGAYTNYFEEEVPPAPNANMSLQDIAASIVGTPRKPNLTSYAKMFTEDGIPSDSGVGTSSPSGTTNTPSGNPYLSTFPRYAGAIGSGLLGLYNAFQRPDEYTATRYKPFTPSGRISLQDQVYNPVDQNMMMNQVLAQGNSARRALRNSGLSPSTAAAMVAQDNNITGNLGNTFLQTWDANNQRRNQVIAANNQNEAQRAQFDYAIDAARQRALSDAQMRNAYTDLQIQQLNNEAEGAKYAAVSSQLSNALQALSGIGQENFAMNQVNSNTANEGYGVLGGGIASYLPYLYRQMLKGQGAVNTAKCGGRIKTKKK